MFFRHCSLQHPLMVRIVIYQRHLQHDIYPGSLTTNLEPARNGVKKIRIKDTPRIVTPCFGVVAKD